MRIVLGLVLVLAGCAPSSFAPSLGRDVSASTTSGSRLLYVSDLSASVVDVYSLPSLKLVQRLSAFFEPQGECTNAAGDVWIVDTGYQQIYEYAPGAKSPIATLSDTFGFPASCAVNPVNGDLAVTDQYGASRKGGVLVFPNATGTPQYYRNGKQTTYDFDAYDDSGNLYVSGESEKKHYAVSRLRAHTNNLKALSISGATIHFAGSVLWNAGKLVLGDQSCHGGSTACLYVATVSGNTATVTSTIALSKSCDVVQVALFNGTLYGGNGHCPQGKNAVDAWSFSNGHQMGAAGGVHEPIGAAISGAPTERR